MAMTSNIYLITNLINNKKYVGQTINIEQRWKNHIKDSTKLVSRYLYRAMNKYGIENFKFEVIEDNIPINLVSEREVHWISELNTKAPNGYNMTDGGEGSVGRKMSEHTKQVLLDYKKNNKVSEESRLKMSTSQKERYEKNPELKQKLSKKLKGIPKNSNENYVKAWESKSEKEKNDFQTKGVEARKVKILMLDIDNESTLKEFESVRSASRWIQENTDYPKAGHQNITKACKGKINYVYGYKWIYKQEDVTTIPYGSKVEDELPLEAQSISN